MKITIKTDSGPLEITNEGYDNPNFLDLVTGGIYPTEGIDIEDLYCAVLAFRTQRDREERRDYYLRNTLDMADKTGTSRWSLCCSAPISYANEGKEGQTNYYICSSCKKPV